MKIKLRKDKNKMNGLSNICEKTFLLIFGNERVQIKVRENDKEYLVLINGSNYLSFL